MRPVLPQIIPTGLRGLDRVLGGGLRALHRAGETAESGTVLVRGAAGTGKTILGLHLAAALAKGRGGGIGYVCTELLPEELAVSASAFEQTDKLAVVTLDGEMIGSEPQGRSVYHSMISVDEGEPGADRLLEALPRLVRHMREKGAMARVIVVDSLAGGYQLGAGVARQVADAVAKFAVEEGVSVVLVEEALDPRPSPWSFAVDTVLELALHTGSELPDGMDRTITVAKHRLGWCDPGPHAFWMNGPTLEVFPRPAAYLNHRQSGPGHKKETTGCHPPKSWGVPGLPAWLPPPAGLTAAVCFESVQHTRHGAHRIASDGTEGVDLVLDFGLASGPKVKSPDATVLGLSDRLTQPWRWLAEAMESISSLRGSNILRRCLVGDLALVAPRVWQGSTVNALTALRDHVTHVCKIPLILFQSGTDDPTRSLAAMLADVTFFGDTPNLRAGQFFVSQRVQGQVGLDDRYHLPKDFWSARIDPT